MEGEGRLGVVGHVDFAQRFVIVEGPVDAAQHHVELGILEFEPEQLERRRHLVFGDAHRLLREPASAAPAARRCGCRPLLSVDAARGREDTEKLKPGPSVHNLP